MKVGVHLYYSVVIALIPGADPNVRITQCLFNEILNGGKISNSQSYCLTPAKYFYAENYFIEPGLVPVKLSRAKRCKDDLCQT